MIAARPLAQPVIKRRFAGVESVELVIGRQQDRSR
jgi:hypothetical protein